MAWRSVLGIFDQGACICAEYGICTYILRTYNSALYAAYSAVFYMLFKQEVTPYRGCSYVVSYTLYPVITETCCKLMGHANRSRILPFTCWDTHLIAPDLQSAYSYVCVY